MDGQPRMTPFAHELQGGAGGMPSMEQAQAEQEKRVAMEEQRRTMLVAILSPEARSRRAFAGLSCLHHLLDSHETVILHADDCQPRMCMLPCVPSPQCNEWRW